jgi:iron-sulfur cluster repair protein YtfE (RIC family)
MNADPVAELAHDHGELNRKVLALSAVVSGRQTLTDEVLGAELRELRDLMFMHFAREEEGLFPFVAEQFPDYEARVIDMTLAHDTICGAVARMVHLSASPTEGLLRKLREVFERFETAYADHSRSEAELLGALATRLDDGQRERLTALVAGL